MNRCTRLLSTATPPATTPPYAQTGLMGLIAALAFALTPWQATQAQSLQRNFPDKALRGTMVVVQPPNITINGQPARLSPGARIRNTNNALALSASLVNQALTVNYLRDGQGLVHEVWILNASEAAQKRPGAATERNYSFAPDEPAASHSPN